MGSAPPLVSPDWPGLVPPTLAYCEPILESPAQIPPQPEHRLAPSIAGLGGVKARRCLCESPGAGDTSLGPCPQDRG